jgi:hypothetical protein
MVVVTGTKRSGTSMWMQVLAAAGLPVLGDRFPARFQRLQAANPAGFWESRLRNGVNWTSNPDPTTGVYLHPEDTRFHGLKVFIPGLARTDHAFLHRVIATVRPWREYVQSMGRLQQLEDDALRAAAPADLDVQLAQRAARRQRRPAELEWWQELYTLVRDTATRRYPVHLVSYAYLLAHKEQEIAAILDWFGEGDVEAAVAAVRPELQTQRSPGDLRSEVLDADAIQLLDDLYEAIHEERVLRPALIQRMNALHDRLPAAPTETAASTPA